MIKQDKSKTVVLKADEVIDHGFVVKVMDLIKSSGFEKLGIAVKKIRVVFNKGINKVNSKFIDIFS